LKDRREEVSSLSLSEASLALTGVVGRLNGLSIVMEGDVGREESLKCQYMERFDMIEVCWRW
jgi:hypothetical protein